jgi:hypothetical protein
MAEVVVAVFDVEEVADSVGPRAVNSSVFDHFLC